MSRITASDMRRRATIFAVALASFASVSIAANAADCPVINGRYSRVVEREGRFFRQSRVFDTRVEGGAFQYNIDKKGTMQIADGIARRVTYNDFKGTLRIYCEGNALVVDSLEDGANVPYRVRMRPLGERQVDIQETNASKSGIYNKD